VVKVEKQKTARLSLAVFCFSRAARPRPLTNPKPRDKSPKATITKPMQQRSTHQSRRQSPGGARVFADDAGRLWNASHATGTVDAAVVFTCISDSRQTARAIAVPVGFTLIDTGDDVLRAWLREAPRMGLLT